MEHDLYDKAQKQEEYKGIVEKCETDNEEECETDKETDNETECEIDKECEKVFL